MRYIELRDRVVEAMKHDIDGFKLVFKEDTRLSRVMEAIVSRLPRRGLVNRLWDVWKNFNTTLYPRVLIDSRDEWSVNPLDSAAMMQHEWVHCKDAETLFGLLPKRTRWLNVSLFYIGYLTPQLFALLAVLAPVSTWALLFLLLLAPLPSPVRMIAEMRAFRRTVELGGNIDNIVNAFTTAKYWFMWPFKRHVKRLLMLESPYKKQMDAVWY